MNHALAREIYDNAVWAILPAVVDPMLESARRGDFDPSKRLNPSALVSSLTGETISEGGKATSKTGKLISETTLNGVVIKNGGASSRGTKEISADLLNADTDPDVLGHLFTFDGPGGSVMGMNYMVGTLGQLTKPKVGIVERSGIAASAHYGILSQMDYILAEDPESEVGSVGTIAGASGHANGATDGDNKKHYIVYATKSIHKNDAEVTALNENDTTLLTERADRANDKLHALVRSKRPLVTDDQLSGKMYPASEVVGTMIDAIGSKQDAIAKIIELNQAQKLTLNQNTAMTTAELKAQHPDTYNEILGIGVAAGVAAEQDRVGTWMAHIDTDLKAVKKGIEAGKEITGAVREALLVKATANAKLKSLVKDSAGNLVVPEGTTEEPVKTEAVTFYDGIMAKLIKK